MEIHRIEVKLKHGIRDAIGEATKNRIKRDLGIDVKSVRTINVYTINTKLSKEELEKVAKLLLSDSVIEDYSIDKPMAKDFDWLIEKGFLAGVKDNVGDTAKKQIGYTIGKELMQSEQVFTSTQYLFEGVLTKVQCESIAERVLGNSLIERFLIIDSKSWNPKNGVGKPMPIVEGDYEIKIQRFDLNKLSDEELLNLSRERCLVLNLEEMNIIRKHFNDKNILKRREKKGLGKEITDCELEILAQTWSEHCKHKEFNATVEYFDKDKNKKEIINGLFPTYIKGSTDVISKRLDKRGKNWLVSVFKDNAGVVRFDEDNHFVFKVETHNSPSALEPYGGAITGIVGVNRDPAGTGMGGSRLLFNTNIFCFGNPFYEGELPPNTLHPLQIFEGVRRGVEHGGNKSGIPTINGSLLFDNRYLGKPLVYCGTGGMMPAKISGVDSSVKMIDPGDIALMSGGRVGKDGIHGVTMASEERHKSTPVTAVQIGDPITQKIMLDFVLEARDLGYIKAITDNGGGGLSSSLGEIAQISGGIKVDLAKVPLKYHGLQPWEIFVSESQERMSIAVSPEKLDKILKLAKLREVELTPIGEFTDSGFLDIKHGNKQVAYIEMEFLHHGLPKKRIKAVWEKPKHKEPDFEQPKDLIRELKRVLSCLDVCSKEYIVRQYDHEVKGRTIVKPLSGKSNDGPSDAAVILPSLGSYEGLVVGHGVCPRYNDIDGYHMSACAFDEMVRNIVATGAKLPDLTSPGFDMWSVNDNFCCPDSIVSEQNPKGLLKFANIVRANKALYDCTTAYNIPCTSGKDSMKNDFKYVDKDGKNVRISVPLTLLYSGAAKIEDVRKVVTIDAKNGGDLVYVLGLTKDELGASQYFKAKGEELVGKPFIGNNVPKVDAKKSVKLYNALGNAIDKGIVASCHDCSDGGLGVALAETAFAGGLGMKIDLRKVPNENIDRDDTMLFSESQSRFVVTIAPKHKKDFEKIMQDNVSAQIGVVIKEPIFRIMMLDGSNQKSDVYELKKAWQEPLRFDLPEGCLK